MTCKINVREHAFISSIGLVEVMAHDLLNHNLVALQGVHFFVKSDNNTV